MLWQKHHHMHILCSFTQLQSDWNEKKLQYKHHYLQGEPKWHHFCTPYNFTKYELILKFFSLSERYWTFVDLEEAFDRVPREVLYWSLRRKRISEKLVRVIRSMYDRAMTTVRSGQGKTSASEIKVGVHQCFSTFLLLRNPTQARRSLTEPHELIRESSDVREDEAAECLQTHLPSRAKPL